MTNAHSIEAPRRNAYQPSMFDAHCACGWTEPMFDDYPSACRAVADHVIAFEDAARVADGKLAAAAAFTYERHARRVTLTNAELIAAVRAHAVEHYNDGGWDVIVECWEDEDIARQIGAARTLKGALRKLRSTVSVFADYEADARNSAF
jgi:hypothetical protein